MGMTVPIMNIFGIEFFLLDVQQLKTVNDNLNGYHIAKTEAV